MTGRLSLAGSDWLCKGYIGEDWLWRNAHRPESRDVLGWLPGSVPGSVQDDLWRAGAIPDPYFGQNSLLIEWVSARTWLYRCTFVAPAAWRGRRVVLRFDGVDYSARFFLNGHPLGAHIGMFTPALFEVGDVLEYGSGNLLAVVIDPAPSEQPQVGYSSRVRTHKTRMSYWWDFCPRLVHLGIWDGVGLEATGPVRVEDVFVRPHLDSGLDRADVALAVELTTTEPAAVELDVTLRGPDGAQVAAQRLRSTLLPGRARLDLRLEVRRPRLWWPNGCGGQPLYQAEVRASLSGVESDARRVAFGIRSVELVANDTPDAEARPYTFVVNGRKIYAAGWNWVPIDALYGVERPQKLAHLVELLVRAHANLLRVWGGGLIERAGFYDACDRAGIMVWQEFIQSSSGIENIPPDDPAYIASSAEEARQIVPLRRNHPCLVLWCGGNELMSRPDQPADEASAPLLAALHAVVDDLDPDRAWLPTSPSGRCFGNTPENIAHDPLGLHDVHGPWEHQGLTGQYTLYNQGTGLLHSEFGVEGLAHLATLERCLPPGSRWPVSRANPAWFHTAAWWLKEDTLHAAFGDLPDLPTTVAASQFLQFEGLRYAVEADRRRQWRCSGTLPWQFNEPYPNAACTSAVDYFGRPKPAYYAVAQAYAPILVSARFARQAWAGEHSFSAEVWACNAGPELNDVALHLRLIGAGGTVYASQEQQVDLAGNNAGRLAAFDWPLSGLHEELFFLDLQLSGPAGAHLAGNRYLFSAGADLSPMLRLPATALAIHVTVLDEGWQLAVSNPGPQAALGLWLEDARAPDASGWVYFDANYVHLLPCETRAVRVAWHHIPPPERRLIVRAWNAAAQVIADPHAGYS